MDRVIRQLVPRSELSRSEYNNVGLTLGSEIYQGRHLLLHYDIYKLFIIISQNVLSTIKNSWKTFFFFLQHPLV